MIDDLNRAVREIRANIAAGELRLGKVQEAMSRLDQAGMYPSQGHEQWQTRKGDSEYLYMTFQKKGYGSDQYGGPDGRRKIYVGIDPQKIAEARRLNRNRLTWEKLKRLRQDIEMWLMWRKGDLDNLLRDVEKLVKKTSELPDLSALDAMPNPYSYDGVPGAGDLARSEEKAA